MEIIFLGTSSGTPTKTRNVSAIAIRKHQSKRWSLVDCGEGTQHQLLHTKLSMKHLEAIYITHLHGDHCYGLPGLLASASMAGRKEALTMVVPLAVKEFVLSMQKATELHLTFALEFVLVEEIERPVIGEDFEVEILKLSHRVPSWGFVFTERHIESKLDIEKLQANNIPAGKLWGEIQKKEFVTLENGEVIKSSDYFLRQRKPRKIAISGDNDQATLWKSIEGLDLLVHEATYTAEHLEKIGKDPQHSCAKEVALFAQEYGLENLILTHFSARYEKLVELENEAKDVYNKRLFLANDFDAFYLTKESQVTLETKD